MFQYGAETAKGVTTMARAPSARALATTLLSRAGGGKAKRVSRWERPHLGQADWSQSPTVKASSDSAEGSA